MQDDDQGEIPFPPAVKNPAPLQPETLEHSRSEKKSRLRYSQMKLIDEALRPLIRRLDDGYCEYVDPDMSDARAAVSISSEIGVEVTHSNIAGIRIAEYGRLKKVNPNPPGKTSALTDRVAKLEEDVAGLLASVTAPPAELPARPSKGDNPRLSKLEAAVANLKANDASREQLFGEAMSRLNHLEERMNQLVEATIAESSAIESRLGSKYRITRRDPRKR